MRVSKAQHTQKEKQDFNVEFLNWENHWRDEKLHNNSLVKGSTGFGRIVQCSDFQRSTLSSLGEEVYLFVTKLLDWMQMIVGEISTFLTL